jgi:hypothetical protein
MPHFKANVKLSLKYLDLGKLIWMEVQKQRKKSSNVDYFDRTTKTAKKRKKRKNADFLFCKKQRTDASGSAISNRQKGLSSQTWQLESLCNDVTAAFAEAVKAAKIMVRSRRTHALSLFAHSSRILSRAATRRSQLETKK